MSKIKLENNKTNKQIKQQKDDEYQELKVAMDDERLEEGIKVGEMMNLSFFPLFPFSVSFAAMDLFIFND